MYRHSYLLIEIQKQRTIYSTVCSIWTGLRVYRFNTRVMARVHAFARLFSAANALILKATVKDTQYTTRNRHA